MFNTRSRLGAVVLGPHAKIDLMAPSHIIIIYWVMYRGGWSDLLMYIIVL